jgi:glycosyltransferase involved in cell wall biosynthesis
MNPRVSVVIASRNYGRYLGGAVRSVLAQTVSDFEIVIIDDGSTDDTPRVMREFQGELRIRYFRTDGLGQSRAKNLGIMHARGELLAFLDGDDEWLPTKLEQQLSLFDHPNVGVVYSRRILMNENGIDQPTTQTPLMTGNIYEELLARNCICFSSVIIRRNVFETVGMFNPKQALAIDYDLWLRIAKHYEFAYADEPLVRYRTGHANLSKRIGERVHIVLSVLRRSLIRRKNGMAVTEAAQGEAWGSTCRTMAYVQRERSTLQALRWYLRAAYYDRQWATSLKNVGGVLYRGLKRSTKESRTK